MKYRPTPMPALPSRIAAIFATVVVAACAAVPPTAPQPTVRVIARFAPAVLDPLDPDFLARLATSARVPRIDPIRAMSGNAYVLQVACDDTQGSGQAADPCAAAVARLSRSGTVIDVTVDRKDKLQSR